MKITSALIIFLGLVAASQAVVLSGLLLKAYCDFSHRITQQGMDPVKAGRTLMTSDPVENFLFQAIAKSYECASKGANYTIVDSSNMVLFIVDMPYWMDGSNPPDDCSDEYIPEGAEAPSHLRIDKNLCDFVEFPKIIDTTDTFQVTNFVTNFQKQVTNIFDELKSQPVKPLPKPELKFPDFSEFSFFG